MTQERRERILTFGIILIAFILLLWPERGYVPIWDGRVYANCAVDAATQEQFSWSSLRCAGHPSYGWTALMALSQLATPGDAGMLLLLNAILGLLAVYAFRAIAAALFPDRTHARALNVLTIACAVHPVLLSTLVQPNVDFGVYVFFLAMYAALLHDRFDWAAVAGTFLVFSKETGAFAAAVLVAAEGGRRLAAAPGGWRQRAVVLRSLWPALLPLGLFGVYLVWWGLTGADHSLVWKHDWHRSTADAFRFFDLSDPVFVSYAAGLFVLGFGWIVTATILADAGVGGVRALRRRATRPLMGTNANAVLTLVAMTFVLTWILTAFRTWSNLRYFAVLYPLYLLLSYAALVRLQARASVRVAYGALLTVLFAWAAVRSSDPVSARLYGTFPIGDRAMYRMTSITGEFAGPGRDELVYNLEFTGFHHLQNALFRELRAGDSTRVVTSRSVRWNLWSQLDARTRQRSLQRRDVIVPRYSDEIDVLATPNPPMDLVFLEFSNREYGDRALAMLTASRYREAGIARIHLRGHLLVAHHLVRRAPQ